MQQMLQHPLVLESRSHVLDHSPRLFPPPLIMVCGGVGGIVWWLVWLPALVRSVPVWAGLQ